jgi:hypothetical protein
VATVALEGSEGTQPGGYGDQVRAVRVQAGDSRTDEHEARLGGHGYSAQLWAVRASASFTIAPSGGELAHVLGHAVLHLRAGRASESRYDSLLLLLILNERPLRIHCDPLSESNRSRGNQASRKRFTSS